MTVAFGIGKRQRNSVEAEGSRSQPTRPRYKKDTSDDPLVSSTTLNFPFLSLEVRARSAITSNPIAPRVMRSC